MSRLKVQKKEEERADAGKYEKSHALGAKGVILMKNMKISRTDRRSPSGTFLRLW